MAVWSMGSCRSSWQMYNSKMRSSWCCKTRGASTVFTGGLSGLATGKPTEASIASVLPYTQRDMCQLLRTRLYYNHATKSFWFPSTADECQDAINAGVFNMLGQLQRWTGVNRSTTARMEKGYCDKNDRCRKIAFNLYGWTCSACAASVDYGNTNCTTCSHKKLPQVHVALDPSR